MKTRHTRLFASVSAAALIGMTALTPMATAQEGGNSETGTTTNPNTPEGDNGALDPWNLNYYTQQVIDQLNNIGYSGPLNDVDDILAAVENVRNDANGGQGEMVNFLNLLAEYIQKPSYNPPAGPVYNEQGQLRDRYTFYYGDNGDNVSPEERYGWEDGTGPALDDEDNITNDRYTAGENGAYIDSANNDFPVNANGTPIQRGGDNGDGAWEKVDTDGMQFDRVTGEWVTDEVVTKYTDDYAAFDSTPRFLDSLNGDTIVGVDGTPVAGETWRVPSGQIVDPPSADDEPEQEQEQETTDELPAPSEGSEWEPVEDNADRVTDGTDYYERPGGLDGDGKWDRVDADGNPVDENGKPVVDPPSDGGNNSTPGDDEVTDNPLDGLNVTAEDGRIEVSFPVDLAGNPHTLTASLDAENGFNVTLTPGSESSTGGGSSNNGGGSSNGNGSSNGDTDQDDDSTVITNPTVTPVYIDADGNAHPAEYDEDDNMVPPEGLDDGTYRLGFQIQGEDGEPVVVGTDYSVKVGDGAMTEADNDEGGGVVQVDNETDADDEDEDDNGNGNGGSGNDPNTASFDPAVTNLESLGAGGGGTDVGGGGTDSDGRVMQNAANDDDSSSSNRTSGDPNAANAMSPAGGSTYNGQGGGPAPASTYDDNTQTHASGQENLAVTGTNTNVLMAAVGSLLLAAAGVFFVGRRKGWV